MAHELCMVRNGDEGRCSQTMPCPMHGARARSTATPPEPPSLDVLMLTLGGLERQLAQASAHLTRNEIAATRAEATDLASIRGLIDGAGVAVVTAAERLRRVLSDRVAMEPRA